MALSYTTALKNAQLDQITAQLDAGAGAGFIRIYSGTPPATVDTALSGNTQLSQHTLSDPSCAAAAAGVLTFNAIADDSSADADGTATFFRGFDSDSNAIVQGTAGESGTDLILDSASITTGQTVTIDSGTITHGN